MTQTPTVEQASRELRDDHRRVHDLADRAASAPDLAALEGALADLHAALTSHFNQEEKPGGLYDALGVCTAEFRQPLAELVDDHFRLAGALRDLREQARTAQGTADDSLREAVARFLSTLNDHERREHDMVQKAQAT
jgi:hemerythrin